MTLLSLVLYVAIAAALLTAIIGFGWKKVNHYPLSFLQNFAGILFIVSGWVKVVDPLGTAFKMQDYFEQFELTFADTALSFLAPLFPFLSEYAAAFSVIVIVFEIVLGVMLILGHRPKWTAWLFLLLVVFFTALTGFTFLTGFVPTDANFFDFASWQDYNKNNMRVTDCGCFGDFIKIEPQVSFLKDLFLLIPALFFIILWRRMHQIFSFQWREIISGGVIIGFVIYALSNFMWDIPDFDFRPFREGVNIYEQKIAEEEAMANVTYEGVMLTNKSGGKKVTMSYDQYLKVYKEYPSEEWKIEYEMSEPKIEPTKISEFVVFNEQGDEVTEKILTHDGYTFIVIAYKLGGEVEYSYQTVYDTIVTVDTVLVEGSSELELQEQYQVVERTESQVNADWKEEYLERFRHTINPIVTQALEDKHEAYTLIGSSTFEAMKAFQKEVNLAGELYEVDNITLKTIVRSNPGLVLIHNGEIVHKWHWKKIPAYEEIKSNYLR